MNIAIKGLRLEFEKARTELDFIEAKVISEFIRKYEIEHHAPTNPHKALSKIKKLKQDLELLRIENDRIMVAKQEFIHDMNELIEVNKEMYDKILRQAGLQYNLETEFVLNNYEIIANSWKLDMDNYQRGRYNLKEASNSNQTNLNISNNNIICNSVKQLEVEDREMLVKDLDFHLINTLSLDEQPRKEVQEEKTFIDKENHEPAEETKKTEIEDRKISKKFVPITDKEFYSVSELIRTRKLTLESVNKVYRCIWDHFKKNKKSPPLTTIQMVNMGLKITGVTGEANLKVLRSLKIIKMEKSGLYYAFMSNIAGKKSSYKEIVNCNVEDQIY
ncbi:spindle and kinetochore-associated protein 2-like isoform X1 [Rhizophagus irregularis DAOM 181602=DAOM 197198]|nr:spindle and kinetochore-associated protein 2-like isoform X1 [Rhizophagus irregularis DAOM 181602=DAOM 197198]